jgi:phage gpG-like protein
MAGIRMRLVLDKKSAAEVDRLLNRISPKQNRNIWRNSLRRMALLVSNNAKTQQIAQGGGPVRDHKLTSRTYSLAGSITEDFAQIPKLASVIAPVPYGAIHEYGGTVTRRAHQRTRDGTTFRVSAHSATYKRRPYLEPALDAMQSRFAPIVIRVVEEEMAKA